MWRSACPCRHAPGRGGNSGTPVAVGKAIVGYGPCGVTESRAGLGSSGALWQASWHQRRQAPKACAAISIHAHLWCDECSDVLCAARSRCGRGVPRCEPGRALVPAAGRLSRCRTGCDLLCVGSGAALTKCVWPQVRRGMHAGYHPGRWVRCAGARHVGENAPM